MSGYQASQRTSEIVALAWGSPRKAQMVSPSAHSVIASATSIHAPRVRSERQAPMKHRSAASHSAVQLTPSSSQVWMPSPPRPTRPWTASPMTTATRTTKRMRTNRGTPSCHTANGRRVLSVAGVLTNHSTLTSHVG